MKLLAEFTISGLPNTINAIGRKHWTIKHRVSKIWHRLVVDQCVLHKISNLWLTKADLEFTRHSTTEPDYDGLVSSFKHVIDGLVLAHVIDDDKPSVIGNPKFFWNKAPRGKGFITIKIFGDL